MNLELARFNMVEQQIRTWEVLDQARFQLRGQHALAVTERYLHIDEGEGSVLAGDEVFAVNAEERIEHRLIQYLPGSNLLLDHIETRLLEIHFEILKDGGEAMLALFAAALAFAEPMGYLALLTLGVLAPVPGENIPFEPDADNSVVGKRDAAAAHSAPY